MVAASPARGGVLHGAGSRWSLAPRSQPRDADVRRCARRGDALANRGRDQQLVDRARAYRRWGGARSMAGARPHRGADRTHGVLAGGRSRGDRRRTWRMAGCRYAFRICELTDPRPQPASNAGTVIIGVAGAQFASTSAPSFIWPGADTGHARDVLLRAHPLLDDGVIEGGVFGRRIGFGSVEAQRWLPPVWHGLLRIAPAVFLDTARASRGLATTDERMQYDLGAGLRLAIPGSGVLRVDLAHGLRDGRTALSVGWQR